jgi:hypothetical protein
MSFITRKHLPRRTFLHGMGTMMALPLLESMVPAQTPLRQTAAQPKSRLGCIYVPHGATMDKWTPATTGKGFEFTDILAPLEPFRDRLCVVSNLAHPQAGGEDGSAGANHTRAAAAFLTGAHPEKGVEAHVGISIDQVVAQRIGQDTPLPSLELSIEEAVLSCEAGFSCAYRNTIAWKSATTPLPMESNPQVVFEKLFGDGSNEAQRLARRRESRSLLDSLLEQMASLQNELPANDRTRLSDYFENVREIERRIQKVDARRTTDLAIPDAPVGAPDSFDEHVKLMLDLQVLAYQAEITRVSTLMFARELSNRTFPESGVRDPFHNLSHHSNDRGNMERFAVVNRYHVQKLGYLLEKLRATPDGDGTLLDHAMILYGSALSDGNEHNHDPLPVLLAGGASGRLQGGVHVQAAPHTTMSNLLLAMLDKFGVDLPQFGDSTGKLVL